VRSGNSKVILLFSKRFLSLVEYSSNYCFCYKVGIEGDDWLRDDDVEDDDDDLGGDNE
jgi:hypothetical protein